MMTSLPNQALIQKSFPLNLTFTTLNQIKDFAQKFIYRYIFRVHQTSPDSFMHFHPNCFLFTGLSISSFKDISEDELWYIWCITVLYATTLVFPVQAMRQDLDTPENASSLLWTLLEWVSPIPWWRKELTRMHHHNHLYLIPSVFIIHRPYFQHPVTNLLWTQNQLYEWKTLPTSSLLKHDPTIISA